MYIWLPPIQVDMDTCVPQLIAAYRPPQPSANAKDRGVLLTALQCFDSVSFMSCAFMTNDFP